jgi:hypothetical protein
LQLILIELCLYGDAPERTEKNPLKLSSKELSTVEVSPFNFGKLNRFETDKNCLGNKNSVSDFG